MRLRIGLAIVFACIAGVLQASTWTSTTLLSVGGKLPDDPALQVHEIGETYWCPPDMVVAWVRVANDDAPDAWMLVSIKPDKIKSIIREGRHTTLRTESTASRYATPGARPHMIVHLPDPGRRLQTPVLPARGRAFIGEIYEWNGETLGPLGDHLDPEKKGIGAFEWMGATYRPSDATAIALHADAAGNMLMLLHFAVPKGRPRRIVVLNDGARFMPLLADGDPLPGLPGVVADLGTRSPFTFDPVAGGTFARLRVRNAPYGEALFWIEPGRTELLSPIGPRQKGGVLGADKVTFDIVTYAVSPRLQVFMASEVYQGPASQLLRTGGAWKTINPSADQGGAIRTFRGVVVSEEPLRYLFMSSRRTGQEIAQVALDGKQTVFDTFHLVDADGTMRSLPHPQWRVPVLNREGPVTDKSAVVAGFGPRFRRFTDGVKGTLIVRDVSTIAELPWSAVRFGWDETGPISEMSMGNVRARAPLERPARDALFLAEGSATLAPAPVLDTDSGEVPLASVIGFGDAAHAFVRTQTGIAHLTRATAPAQRGSSAASSTPNPNRRRPHRIPQW